MRGLAKELVRLIRSEIGRGVRRGVEVGVWRGDTSEGLLRWLRRLKLVMVDPWDSGGLHTTMPKTAKQLRVAEAEARLRTDPFDSRRTILKMESEIAAARLKDDRYNFVFIDAEHTYEQVKQDIGLWWPKVRSGGILCGHDYNGRGDRSGSFGVKRAVDEWAEKMGLELNIGKQLIWWVRKP